MRKYTSYEPRTARIGVKVTPSLRNALERVAENESRSLSNVVHCILEKYLVNTGILKLENVSENA